MHSFKTLPLPYKNYDYWIKLTTDVASQGLLRSFGTIYRPLEFATSINAVSPYIIYYATILSSLKGVKTSMSLTVPSGSIECMQSTKPSPPSDIGKWIILVDGKFC